jgi:hypothetical protein
MFVHCVFFWLKPELEEKERTQVRARASALTRIPAVKQGWLGKPAATDRPVIDRSYSYALTVAFDDEAGHDAYQVDPVHDAFRKECAHLWNRVQIYDFED